MDEQAAIEDWVERSSIMEFEAGMRRANAESMALRDVVERRGKEAGQAVQAWRNEQR